MIKEYVIEYSTAKYTRWNRPEYMTGALARFNNNYDQLTDGAKTAADELGLPHPCHKPFMITIAQLVECIHCLEDAGEILRTLLAQGIQVDTGHEKVKDRAGTGVGAVEAPRGILFHEYRYDDRGKCLSANMVIPTAQNLANLEADMHAFAPTIAHDYRDHNPSAGDAGSGLRPVYLLFNPCYRSEVIGATTIRSLSENNGNKQRKIRKYYQRRRWPEMKQSS